MPPLSGEAAPRGLDAHRSEAMDVGIMPQAAREFCSVAAARNGARPQGKIRVEPGDRASRFAHDEAQLRLMAQRMDKAAVGRDFP